MLKLLAAVACICLPTAAFAADTVPDLKGTWTGDFDFVVFGNNSHHPGSQGLADTPRTGHINFTFEVEGQDGRSAWGKSWSDPATKEPFAWVAAPDGTTIFGSDTDGVYHITVLADGSLQLCYANPATSPSGAIIASCGTMTRKP